MRAPPLLAALGLGAVILAVCGAFPNVVHARTKGATGLWSAYGRAATAANDGAVALTDADVAMLRRRWNVTVGGSLTAQPLYVPAVTISGHSRTLLLVASSTNVVTAIDPTHGTIVWRRSLGPTRPQVCGGSGGIESTPAVDLARGRVYVIGADGHLRALSLATGVPVPRFDVQIIKRTDVETVWGALRLSDDRIYVPVASWCDKPDAQGAWDGRLVAVSAASGHVLATFDPVPGPANGGGIWGPGGISVDPRDGTIWTATANAVVFKNGGLDEKAGLAERVVHLTRNLGVLGSVVQPDSNQSILGDQGFGATPMLFQPAGCPPLLAVNSKDSYTYVWRRDKLTAAPIVRMKLGQAAADDTFYAQPTWIASSGTLVVGGVSLPNGGAGAVGLRLGKGCTFTEAWQADIGGGVQPQPLGSGDVVFVSATATHSLDAIDAASGRLVADLDLGTAGYTAPMMAGSLVVVGTASGSVQAFGSMRRVTGGR
ncbi:MAG TPA: PQQ-binding-like beta-propeller repeat protein [Gaiellaceae bacterium]|jgi:outer membrane protein assembly factor BamB